MNATQTHRERIDAYVEAFNRHDADALHALFTPDATIAGVLGSFPIERAVGVWRELHDAYAIELTIVDCCVEGDTAAVRYIERGRSRASFRGEPVTGATYTCDAMEWFRFANGRIAARWGARDNLSIRRQLGLPLAP